MITPFKYSRPLQWALILTLLTVLSENVNAQTVSVTPARDTTIIASEDARSNAQGELFSGTPGSGITVRCLLHFDVAAMLPEGARITEASLRLTLRQGSPESGVAMHSLHRLAADWGEGSSIAGGGAGAEATAGDATWRLGFHPDEMSAWATPGGDFDAEPSATQEVGTMAGTITWAATPKMLADLQSWIDTPTRNFGWILIGDEEGRNTARKFASREAELTDERPTLVITYEQDESSSSTSACGTDLLAACVVLLCLFVMPARASS